MSGQSRPRRSTSILILVAALAVQAGDSASCAAPGPTTPLSTATALSPTAAPISPITTPTRAPLPPLSASGGGVIAFSSDRSGHPGIWVMNADGSDPRLLADKEDSTCPAFSPDGARIVFDTAAPYMGGIYTMKLDGTDRQRVFSQNRFMSDPNWSPDGRQIVFVYHTHVYFSISVMDIDGGNLQQLTRPVPNQSNGAPDWSPDGRRIVFSSDRDGNWEIYTMNADGSQPRRLTNHEAEDLDPAWRPD